MSLQGMRVAVLVEDKYEDQELWYPYYRLQEAGAEVVLAHAVDPSVYQTEGADEADRDGALVMEGPDEAEARGREVLDEALNLAREILEAQRELRKQTDAEIESDVRRRFELDPRIPQWLIEVTVEDGVVRLAGAVGNAMERTRARDAACPAADRAPRSFQRKTDSQKFANQDRRAPSPRRAPAAGRGNWKERTDGRAVVQRGDGRVDRRPRRALGPAGPGWCSNCPDPPGDCRCRHRAGRVA